MKTKTRRLLLFSILILAFILRFWHYDQRYIIVYDSSRDAIVSFESARQLQLSLTGSFSSIGPITFGPWYYYYITFANFIIPSIWAPWIAIGLTSLLMVFIMYKIGVLLVNPSFGLLLALITAISPAQINASIGLQQHALIGLLSSLIIYLFMLVNKKNYFSKLSLLWGFFSGVAINIHFQATGLLTLPFLYIIFGKKRTFIINFMLGLFISMIPILAFELNNHWFNTRNIIDYIFIGQYRVWTSNRWLTFLGQFWPDFWSFTTGLDSRVSLTIMITLAFILFTKFIKSRIPIILTIISFSFILQLVMLRYYRGEKFFGYLQFFHPFIFIYTGLFIYYIFKRFDKIYIKLFTLALYLLLVLPNSFKNLEPYKFNIETKQRVDFLVQKYPATKFSTFECKPGSDTNRIQGLLLLLYMHKLYDDNGEKIAIKNPFCGYGENKVLDYDLVDVNNLSEEKLQTSGLVQMTPLDIYKGTARWWFKEQP